jgi:hypothetical protein
MKTFHFNWTTDEGKPNESNFEVLTRARADPLVRKACQLFDAEVVEVKPLRLVL